MFGQSRGEPGDPRDARGLWPELVDAAEKDVIDRTSVEAGAVDDRLEDLCRQIGWMDGGQPTTAASHGGADGVDDECFDHGLFR